MTEIADLAWQIIVDQFKARHVDPTRVIPDARLVEDQGADTLNLVEIAFALEDQFGEEISETEMEKIATVGMSLR